MDRKLFLIWEFFLYVGFTAGDVWRFPWSDHTDEMKYAAVISCFLYAWAKSRRTKKSFFTSEGGVCGADASFEPKSHEAWSPLHFALLYVVWADYFLLFTDVFALGILCFCGVQLCYGMRIRQMADRMERAPQGREKQYRKAQRKEIRNREKQSKKTKERCLIVGGALLAMILFTCKNGWALLVQNQNKLLPGLVVFYVLLSLFNLVSAGRLTVKAKRYESFKRQAGLLFFGILLLFLCDIHVGLNQIRPVLGGYFAGEGCVRQIFQFWLSLVSPAMWFFYLPSQICIVMAIFDSQNNQQKYLRVR